MKYITKLILLFLLLATLACSSQYADITGDAFDIITDKQALTINLLYDTAKDEFYTKEYDDYLYIQESVDTGDYILEDDEYEWFEDLLVSLNEIIDLRDFRDLDYEEEFEEASSVSATFKGGVPNVFYIFRDKKPILSGTIESEEGLIDSITLILRDNMKYYVIYGNNNTPEQLLERK